MEEFLVTSNAILIFILGWTFWFLLKIKTSVDSQQKIIESFKGQSEVIRNLQEMYNRLYDPEKIEHIIQVEKKFFEAKLSDQNELLEKEIENLKSKIQQQGKAKSITFNEEIIRTQAALIQLRRSLGIHTYLFLKYAHDNELFTEERVTQPIFLSKQLSEIERKLKRFIEEKPKDEAKLLSLVNEMESFLNLNKPIFEEYLTIYGY